MRKAGDLLEGFFDEETRYKAKQYSDLFNVWANIAGPNIAAHSRIAELRGSVVEIEADHPGWVQRIQLRQADYLKAFRRLVPDLEFSGLSIRLSGKRGMVAPAVAVDTSNGATASLRPENDEFAVRSEASTEAGCLGSELSDEESAVPESDWQAIGDADFRAQLKALQESIKRKNRPTGS